MNNETKLALLARLEELGCTMIDTRGEESNKGCYVLAMREHSHDRFVVWAVCESGAVIAGDYCNDIQLAAKWLYERAGE